MAEPEFKARPSYPQRLWKMVHTESEWVALLQKGMDLDGLLNFVYIAYKTHLYMGKKLEIISTQKS